MTWDIIIIMTVVCVLVAMAIAGIIGLGIMELNKYIDRKHINIKATYSLSRKGNTYIVVKKRFGVFIENVDVVWGSDIGSDPIEWFNKKSKHMSSI